MDFPARRLYAKLSISAHPDLADAALVMATEDAHGNFSKPWQESLESEAEARWGRGWRDVVRTKAAAIRNGHGAEREAVLA